MQLTLRRIAALFVAGLIVGVLTHGALSEIFARSTLYLFIPALIFEAAWHLRIPELRRHWMPVLLLAVPGVAITFAIVAWFSVGIAHIPVGNGLLLGAILAATDPIAVVAVFRRLHVPHELVAIVESESLFNDAVAVVLYRAILASIVVSGALNSPGHIALISIAGSLGSLIIGVVTGSIGGKIAGRIAAPVASIAVSILGGFGVYALCDALHWSGIFAVIAFAAAMRLAYGGTSHRRIPLERAWHIIAVFANGALFFLMGAALDVTRLRHIPFLIASTLLAVFVARLILAYGLLGVVRLPWSWKNVVRVAGMRGALSLALALAIPSSIPGRGAVQIATFAVVIVTVLTGTLTLEPRLRKAQL